MDPSSSKRSRSREAMADVPQKPSRSHCCDGLLHRPSAHVWCSVPAFSLSPMTGERSYVMRWQRRRKSYSSGANLLFCYSAEVRFTPSASIFCRISLQSQTEEPKILRQVGRILLV